MVVSGLLPVGCSRGAFDRKAKASSVQLYGHILRRDVITKALEFEVQHSRSKGQPKQVEDEMKK